MRPPQSLRDGVISRLPGGRDWADSLPVLLDHARRLWRLRVGEPYEGASTAGTPLPEPHPFVMICSSRSRASPLPRRG